MTSAAPAAERLAFDNPLIIPPLLAPSLAPNGGKTFDFVLQQGERAFRAGGAAETWGVNGDYLGPTVRVRKGDKVAFNIRNNLPETTTIHWHGMDLPAIMDGGPYQAIEPGTDWSPHWTVVNEAATLWYHPHLMGRTAEHVHKGIAGLFLIDDDNSDRLAVPKTYGIDDIPVIVQDRTFDGAGNFIYKPGLDGSFGDTILVNGTLSPFVDVPAGRIRLRLVNASNTRRYDFALSDGRIFTQIASDGGLLPSPVAHRHLMLAPGERAEIVVDLPGGETIRLISNAIAVDGGLFIRTMRRMFRMNRDEGQAFDILELRAPPGAQPRAPLPAALNAIARIEPATSIKMRKFVLDESHKINDKKMDHDRIDEVVKSGSTEIWEIEGDWVRAHSFHIHAVQFQILSRNGATPPPHEMGWKDTVIVERDEIVRLIMRFPAHNDPLTPYMYHCHLLEHEDGGMMGQFLLVDDLTSAAGFRPPKIGTGGHKH
jgi:bilirubin oxidase